MRSPESLRHHRIGLELRELRFEVDLLLRRRALLRLRVAHLLLRAIEQLHVELHQLGQLVDVLFLELGQLVLELGDLRLRRSPSW